MLTSDTSEKDIQLLGRVRSVLHSQRVRQWSSLVEIQPHGSKLPVFGIHPADGEVFFYHRLAPLLGPDQPVYGLRAQGLDGKSQPLSRVEDIAAAYVREVLLIQPHGPYIIVGRCGGSRVAYEMAQQLSRSGETIRLLCVIDPGPISRPTSIPHQLADLARYIRYHVRRGHLWKAVVRSAGPRLRRVRAKLDMASAAIHSARSRDARPRVTARRARNFLREALVSSRYRASPYHGGILFISAADAVRHDDPRDSWGRLAMLECLTVPGDHRTIASPENLPILAHHLRRVLDEAAVRPRC